MSEFNEGDRVKFWRFDYTGRLAEYEGVITKLAANGGLDVATIRTPEGSVYSRVTDRIKKVGAEVVEASGAICEIGKEFRFWSFSEAGRLERLSGVVEDILVVYDIDTQKKEALAKIRTPDGKYHCRSFQPQVAS